MSTPNAKANQRAAPRVQAGGDLWVHCRRAGSETDLANGLLDLSAGGVQILSKELLRVGDVVEIGLSGSCVRDTIRRPGEVRWVVELGGGACCVGVCFASPLELAELRTLALPAADGK
jgi:PilZ domain